MSSLVVKSLQISAFIIATVALFLNINAGVGLSNSQHIQLSIDINLLNSVPDSYDIYMDNVTINTAGLRSLDQCVDYVESHIPVIDYFNATIVINVTYAENQLANLTTLMEGRGTISILQNGTVRVEETNATIPYSKEYILFGDAPLYYIGIEPTPVSMTVRINGTTGLTFSGWSPSIGISASSGYNAIYDANQLDIQSALPVIRVQKKQYLSGEVIVVGESETAINDGDVVSVREKLQL